MPKINMELGMTCKVGENWIKAIISVADVDVELDIVSQLEVVKVGLDKVYDVLVEQLEEKLINQIDSGKKIVKK